jgi:hypothetical protein
LKIDAAEPAVKFGVAGSKSKRLAKGDDGIVPFFLSNLDVGAGTQRIERGSLAGVGAIEFRESRVILFLLDEKMDRARFRARSIRLYGEIVAISSGSFGLFLRVESLR